jgi:glycerophosphoryl diester phosphodiesterase
MNSKGFVFIQIIFLFSFTLKAQIIPLDHAHAHNDYKHKQPLTDAINNGFTSVEADVFLKNNRLIVAHISPFFKNKKTLESLYLKPLSDSIAKNHGKVYSLYTEPVILLIDIKTNADETYKVLKPLLEKYSSILTSYENGEFIKRAVTIILSGNKPYALISNEKKRFAFIDENLMNISENHYSSYYCPVSSTKYSNLLSWNGRGNIPENEKMNLKVLVDLAHAQGKKVRLWASPENENVWKELLISGVDLINTDHLEKLKNFLLKEK